MSEQNLSEKIAQVITNAIKKTNIFEKIQSIQGLIIISTGLFIVTTTLSMFFIKNIYLKNDEQIKLLKINNNTLYQIKDDNNFIYFKMYEEFKKKIDKLIIINIENQKLINTLIKNNEDKSAITFSTMTSTSDFENYCKNIVELEPEKKDVDNVDDIELYEHINNEKIQEVYDNLPCNNLKKNTSGFFSW